MTYIKYYHCFRTYLDYDTPTKDLNPFEQVLDKTENQFSWNCKTAQEYFLSSKFDNVLTTFFVDDL